MKELKIWQWCVVLIAIITTTSEVIARSLPVLLAMRYPESVALQFAILASTIPGFTLASYIVTVLVYVGLFDWYRRLPEGNSVK